MWIVMNKIKFIVQNIFNTSSTCVENLTRRSFINYLKFYHKIYLLKYKSIYIKQIGKVYY